MLRSILLGAVVALLAVAGSAQAAPPARAAKVAEPPPPIRPVAAFEPEAPTSCNRARRRLWVENEGWVVRRITTCR